MTQYWPDSKNPQWSRQAVITVSRSTWMTTNKQWSRLRSFLYGCDRSPEIRILKLGTGISNLNTNYLVYKIGLEILSSGVRLRVRKD